MIACEVNTDNRKVIDVVLPGFTEKDVSVKVVPLDETIEVKLKSTIKKGVGFYKTLIGEKDKIVFNVNSERFNLELIEVSFENGVLRISVPKVEDAIGVKIFPNNTEE